MVAKGEVEGEGEVKKKLAVLILCFICFVGGGIFHCFYMPSKCPVKTKAMQRWELGKTLKLARGKLDDVTIIEEKNMGSYMRRLLRFRWEGLFLEAYLLIPHGSHKTLAAVLALPGHNSSKEEVIGRKTSRFGINYGLQFVKAGFCVLAPDIPFSENKRIEDHVALNLIMTGRNLTGIRVSYLKAHLDYLASLPFIDPERLGCVGWSLGGGLAMYLSAVDTRVKVVAVSNYFGTYKDTFMRIRQSTDNYIPGILNFGDMADVACLIAPRPLWFENAEQDQEFPQEAFIQGIEDLKKCYGAQKEHLSWQLISGGHRFEGKGLEEWFKRWL